MDSDLICPFVTGGADEIGSTSTGAEQHELCTGAVTGICTDRTEVGGAEQHEAVTGGGAGAGTEQQEAGAEAGTSRSTGSVVTCSPRATRS